MNLIMAVLIANEDICSKYMVRDVIVVCIYYLNVTNCFILSTRYPPKPFSPFKGFSGRLILVSFHIFSNHSSEMHRFGNELDHLGVVFVWGSAIPETYFAFYCIPSMQYLYRTLVSRALLILNTSGKKPPDHRLRNRVSRLYTTS
jgi:adiponectin receptor